MRVLHREATRSCSTCTLDERGRMAQKYSRLEFYELVWSKPVTHLAKEFALSDVAIHKICRKHQIPTPPLGWWAKKQAGKPVSQTPLPELSKDVSDTIVIAAAELRCESTTVAATREEARIRASDDANDNDPPNPIVKDTIDALRAAVPEHNGLAVVKAAGLIHCEVAPASFDRLEKILNAIVLAARKQGFELGEGKVQAQFVGDGETIGFSVIEVFQRLKHQLTPAELAKQDRWRKRWIGKSNPWDEDDAHEPFPSVPEWEYVCTGKLGFEMEGVHVPAGNGPRKSFRDAKIQRLENMTSDIGVALAVLAVAKREGRHHWEAEQRKRDEERRERERPFRLEFVEKRRVEALDQVLEDLAGVERLRSLMKGLGDLEGGAASPRVSSFLTWAQRELQAREKALSRSGLEARFDTDRIFGEDDDHAFKSHIWW